MENASNPVKTASEGRVRGTELSPRPLAPDSCTFLPAVLNLLTWSVLRPRLSVPRSASIHGRKKASGQPSFTWSFYQESKSSPTSTPRGLPLTSHRPEPAPHWPVSCKGAETGVWSSTPKLPERQSAWRGLSARRLVGVSPRTEIWGWGRLRAAWLMRSGGASAAVKRKSLYFCCTLLSRPLFAFTELL